MSVSVSIPQLGESVTEGTVTRWLKKEGERVEADEPLLEVSTDKVDTEIPSPAAGVLRNIAVGEDETVEVGAQLAEIEQGADRSADGSAAPGGAPESADGSASGQPAPSPSSSDGGPGAGPVNGSAGPAGSAPAGSQPGGYPGTQAPPAPPAPAWSPPAPPSAPSQPAPPQPARPSYQPQGSYGSQPSYGSDQSYGSQQAAPPQGPPAPPAPPAPSAPQPAASGGPGSAAPQGYQRDQGGQFAAPTPLPTGDGPYVTPLVRKLASEQGVDLEAVSGTGVGGRIRKQDVLDAARAQREAEATRHAAAPPAPAAAGPAPAAAQAGTAGQGAAQPGPTGAAGTATPSRRAIVPSTLRGTTQRMSRPRQVIAQRMVESLQTSAQLTTVVEADVTAIARLRARARGDFEAREGVKLTFLPFFALAAVEALKVYPTVNAVIDAASNQVTYHDAEHLGIAVDTERGLTVPVIHNAGDLNLGGLARKIADLAARTRSGQVSVDELSGGTFTLTNTGSRGALFDTPIINQPQVAILGTGTVVKRAVVVEDPALGEVIAVRSMVYLALTYDHRLVDGADAARFLTTVKERLEEGSFDAELGL
jgi:pyruvate dehydrogenase E2 component (dihydrolipoamide acetyltransferase)